MKENRTQTGSAILGVFGFLIALLAAACLGLVSFIAFFGRGPNPVCGAITLLLAIATIVGGFAALRVSGVSHALDRKKKEQETES